MGSEPAGERGGLTTGARGLVEATGVREGDRRRDEQLVRLSPVLHAPADRERAPGKLGGFAEAVLGDLHRKPVERIGEERLRANLLGNRDCPLGVTPRVLLGMRRHIPESKRGASGQESSQLERGVPLVGFFEALA